LSGAAVPSILSFARLADWCGIVPQRDLEPKFCFGRVACLPFQLLQMLLRGD